MNRIWADSANCELLPNGRLRDLARWNEDVAYMLAEREGIQLTDAHWEVIAVMRIFYQEYNVSPMRKLLKKAISERLGPEKSTERYLHRLFPGDPLVQGTRIAGIPEPVSDGQLEHSWYPTEAPVIARMTRSVNAVTFEGREYRIYSNGNLVDLEQWNERLAAFLAEREGLQLGPEHWEVIYFLRGFYFEYGISPMVRLLIKHMRATFGPHKSSERYLYALFPGGPSRQGSRIAGLPEPQGCIDP